MRRVSTIDKLTVFVHMGHKNLFRPPGTLIFFTLDQQNRLIIYCNTIFISHTSSRVFRRILFQSPCLRNQQNLLVSDNFQNAVLPYGKRQ